jgi:hypothetical protein
MRSFSRSLVPTRRALVKLTRFVSLATNNNKQDLQDGYEDLIMPVPNCAHMFVTKHGEQLCFNNACTVHDPDLKTFLSSNG